ncbi:MAG: aminotransferase class I/II-fold pyridoxal phosphate-dependent enzyme [Deltaproteobacteria bacterium]|nr:aminotransferase class I/II-fold pyridoxal phosphate-dependent enzyme [Deltaproteobacteria bacterium]MBW2697604.1 aminotransferase class I/II-fold pyridoxal phosphate-dependent enzyme [Deltaproteobacteria bacterium]
MTPPATDPPTKLSPLAQGLNDRLEAAAPAVLKMLSEYGRRLYFPKGILSQSAEASEKAHRFNATIGIATEGDGPMYLPSIQQHLADIDPKDAYTYAPTPGRPGLRAAWRDKLLKENPSLPGRSFGLPIVTSAITHGLGLVGDLFVDPGDVLLLPDKLWGNYRLTYEVHFGGQIVTFPFYEASGFNVKGFAQALARAAEGRTKLLVLLNFPNNPTGYMPTPEEGEAIVGALHAQAKAGTRLVVITDDAYFGLFYHLGGASMTESLFAALTGLHENLLAVKLDGATKELFVWGLRCGFMTFGPGDAGSCEEVCAVLESKVKGAIRGGISNVPQLSQSLVEQALGSSSIEAERKQKCETLRVRAERVDEVARAPRFSESWDVYPFNSGYFMCVRVKGVEAERLRVHLLDEYGVGLIATAPEDIRIAFSCLEVEEVEPLFEALHKAIQELC